MERVYNFAAGPSILPEAVLRRAEKDLLNYQGTGMSVMEMSHRSKAFQTIFDHTEAQFRKLMHVPSNYKILFLQGGGSTQFSMVPMNLMSLTGKADYALTGNFSSIAAKEAAKYGEVHTVCSSADRNFSYIPAADQLKLSGDAGYFHYCANNTIFGTEWNYIPDTGDVPIVCDMSSNITSKVVDISRYGIIYAGAQKNMGPAGVTVVIIREDLAGHELPETPLMLSYQRQIDKGSMYNTPPCWSIYMLGLVMDWLEEAGGVEEMERIKHRKAQQLYSTIDASGLFHCTAEKSSRSDMNVVFRSGSDELDLQFVKEAAEAGFVNLKGHRLTGGLRASIYNAMPEEGVAQLCDFIRTFEAQHR